jgi:hypothetical protein
MLRRVRFLGLTVVGAVLVMLVIGCGRTEVVRYTLAPPDAGMAVDAGPTPDAGIDAGVDAGVPDAGQPDAGIKPCIDGRFTLTQAEPVVMLVIDRSGSMIDLFPGGTTSKWNAIRNALNQTLPAVDNTMQLGVVFFPIDGADDCEVPAVTALAPGRGQASIILNTIAVTEPRGLTPTSAAVRVAFDILSSRRAANTARGMVLATDGEPTCATLATVEDDLRMALDAGVPTWVVGIESSSQPDLTTALDAMARAGGRARIGTSTAYFSATSATGVVDAFTAIRDQVAACSFLSESVPNLDGGISVTYGTEVVPFDPSGVSGWMWTDRNNGELVLRGSYCTRAITMPQPLHVLVSCSP